MRTVSKLVIGIIFIIIMALILKTVFPPVMEIVLNKIANLAMN